MSLWSVAWAHCECYWIAAVNIELSYCTCCAWCGSSRHCAAQIQSCWWILCGCVHFESNSSWWSSPWIYCNYLRINSSLRCAASNSIYHRAGWKCAWGTRYAKILSNWSRWLSNLIWSACILISSAWAWRRCCRWIWSRLAKWLSARRCCWACIFQSYCGWCYRKISCTSMFWRSTTSH